MNGCFYFRFQKGHITERGCLALFFSSAIDSDIIIKILKQDVEKNLVPESVYVISLKNSTDYAAEIRKNDSFNSEFESFVGDSNLKLLFLSIDQQGSIINSESCQAIDVIIAKAILQCGMLDIFKRRKGLITSSPSYHFVKPSGDHCDKFIRASNLLVSGEEVSFLAVSLFPHLHENIKRIYVDTSSISYLVSTAAQLSGRYTNRMPLIESFESYRAIKTQYDFIEDEGSLVLISATTSGSLAKKIINETAFTKKQVITLFHRNLPADQIGVFDISLATPTENFSLKASNCHLCKKGSRIIRIVGDQFLPETPKHELLMIKKNDFEKDRSAFIKEFATKKILSWNKESDPKSDSKEHFFIDVVQLINDSPPTFNNDFIKKIKKHLTRDTKTILHLDDPGSMSLSSHIKSYLGDDAVNYEWLGLNASSELSLKDKDSVMVIAGAITSGRRLLDASRKLRSIKNGAAITYFVGFSQLPNSESLKQLKNDLEHGGHVLVILREIPMPRIKGYTSTAWDCERMQYRKVSDELGTDNTELPGFLKTRSTLLDGNDGNDDTLFLLTTSGETLKLRQTFAFWVGLGLNTNEATQADVYWTMQGILHDLRMRSDEKGLASTYHSTLISPACFDRFNDGVIQAALLRAAEPAELNYAVDDDFSRKMTDVIISVLKNNDNAQGEASMEFLLALCTGRINLDEKHVREIIDLDHDTLPLEMRFLIKNLPKYGRQEG